LYFTPKEGNEAYDKQCDINLKPEHLWLQALWVVLNDKTFFCQICEDLMKDCFAISFKGQLKNQR
jgi:hypothetical protein